MKSVARNRKALAAIIIRWTVTGIAGTALLLWLLDMIKPPAPILAGVVSVLIVLSAGRKD